MAATTAPTHGDRQRAGAIEPRAYRAFQLPQVLNLSRAYVTRLIASGDLPSFRVGTARFVATVDIDAWLDRQRAATGR